HIPDLVTRYLAGKHPAVTLLGIDENTALVGGPHQWTVHGQQSVWRLGAGEHEQFAASHSLETQ
ncbi:MAG: hypothetical protein WCG62_06405, partial [Actinomycetes bacterium]